MAVEEAHGLYGLSGVISINYLHPSKVNDLHPSEVGRQLLSSIELHYTFDDDVCQITE